MLERLKPAVPRHHLYAIAGLLWMFAGALLCYRGVEWLGDVQLSAAFGVGIGALVLAVAFYATVFSRLVRKNIDRIGLLPDRPSVFAFTAPRGYLMIGLMMTAGITLRNSAIPRYYLSLPYSSMGAVLLTGSVQVYREFVGALRRRAQSGSQNSGPVQSDQMHEGG